MACAMRLTAPDDVQDADGSGEVDFEEFKDWWTHGGYPLPGPLARLAHVSDSFRGPRATFSLVSSGVLQPPKGGTVFRQISEKMEAKAKNVRFVHASQHHFAPPGELLCTARVVQLIRSADAAGHCSAPSTRTLTALCRRCT
jgi:hypothetical protein